MYKNAIIKIITLTIFFTMTTAFSQVDSTELKQNNADGLFDVGEYELAIQVYKDLISLGETSASNYYKYGLAMVELYDPIDGLPLFKEAEKKGLTESIDTRLIQDEFNENYYSFELNYNLARGYHLTSDFTKAIKYYQNYIDLSSVTKEEKQIVHHYLEQAISGKKFKENTDVELVVENLGSRINSEYDDFGSLVYNDTSTIIFTRRKPNKHPKSVNIDGSFKEDVYMTKIRKDGRWIAPYRISSEINIDQKDDFAVALNGDNDQLIIEYENGDLFESKRTIQTWSKPKKLPKFINSSNEERGITITDDVMIISSNRAGTLGGLDLFYSFKNDQDEWDLFEPLNAVVNTPFDDCYPFLDPFDKTLYFSSKGHSSTGGYDIFKSRFNPTTNNWDEPENLGYPINTPRDDIYFTFLSNGNVAYYTSFKEDGFGGLDIYKVDYNHKLENLTTVFIDVFANDTLEEPLVSKIVIQEVGKVTGLNLTSDKNGSLRTELVPDRTYNVTFASTGYFAKDTTITLEEGLDSIRVKVLLDPIREGEIITLKRVNFERDKARLNIAAYTELDLFYEMLLKNPTLAVEIAGHTEIGGLASSNKELSQNRADAVKEYLIRKGVDDDRLLSSGYGASYPLSKGNKEIDKSKNRRTEMILHIQEIGSDDWKPFYSKR